MRPFAHRPSKPVFALLLGLALAPATPALGQLPETNLHALFPPGGQAGQTLEVQATSGKDMEDSDELVFGHPGFTAVRKTRELLGEQVPVDNTFVVTIDPSVPPGNYEVRLGGYFGVSNPRTFAVGDRPETNESEANNGFDEADETAIGRVVNATVNGGADIDYFQFNGKQGQHVVAAVQARRIDSKLDPVLEIYDANHRRLDLAHDVVRGDAVLELELPADGTYFCKVYDFAYAGSADHFYRLELHTGPHVDILLPPSGQPGSNEEYTVYGRNLPGGQPSGVTLGGRELQQVKVRIALPAGGAIENVDPETVITPSEAGLDAITWRLDTPAGRSNAKLVYLASAPVVLEQEPNDDPQSARKVDLPVEIAGQFQARGDLDVFTFEAKAGEVWYVEVFGHRQGGSTADPYFVLDHVTTNDKGEEQVKRITAQDDFTPNVDNNRPKPTNGLFNIGTADPIFRFEVPADGTYRLELRDRYHESRGDPSLLYRLAITPERPDFRLVVLPLARASQNNQPPVSGSITLRRGESVLVPVMAIKRDGFDGIVDVEVGGLPAGVTASPAAIGPGDVGTSIVLTAAADAAVAFGDITVAGTARITDPAKDRAIDAARKDLPKRRGEIPKLEQAANKANEELKPAEEASNRAKEAASQKPEDENLAKQRDSAQQKFDQLATAAADAADALATKQREVADLAATIEKQKQERDASAGVVTHPARFATVVWDGQQNVSSPMIRLVRSLGVSVLEESVPYAVSLEADRIEVNQGRQVIVPVKVENRDGFKEKVTLSFQGLPKNSNIVVGNNATPEEMSTIFVKDNALVGAYTVYLSAQSSYDYVRNPQRVERFKARRARADEMLKAANETKQQADQARGEAERAANEAANVLKNAQQNLQQTENEAKSKPDDEPAKQALETARKEVEVAEATVRSTGEAKTQAEQAVKSADDSVKQSTEAKKQADNELKNAENLGKSKKINVAPPSTSFVLVVEPAPVKLTSNVPDGGNLKQGETIDVKVTVNRVDDFTGPVTLVLPDLPSTKGLSAEPVTIPADQTEGTLVIAATGDAKEGPTANAVVRATMDYDGQAAVDVPVTIKISK